MTRSILQKSASPDRDTLLRSVSKLQALFEKMDREYQAVSEKYGFVCGGCVDNCCRTRFYHHTFIEYHYIRQGFETISEQQQQKRRQTASVVDQIHTLAHREGTAAKEMCPLNMKGRCILYAYRPMICRLHGLPHELRRPGKAAQNHPGCNAFYEQCRQPAYIRFDRTPFYIEMSALERELKSALGISERIKMTVAQMLLM
jgi:hypothetical protein